MIDLNSVGSLIRYEICSDQQSGYRGFLRGPLISSVDRAGDALAQVAALLAQPMPAKTGDGQAPDHVTPLSFRVEPGNNFYLITITRETALATRARFGPGAAPLVLLPPNIGEAEHPLAQFGLYRLDGDHLQHWPHSQIPADHHQVSAEAWAGFACDQDRFKRFFIARRSDPDQPFAVPFYFNLYDMPDQERILPIWELAAHEHEAKHVETHGGIHPTDGDAGGVTHGGIHPTVLTQYAYV